MRNTHINEVKYAFYKEEVSASGSLQDLKYNYFKQRLGL